MTRTPASPTPNALTRARQKPDIVTVPERTVLALDGAGSPDQAEFAQAVGALYGVSYGIRFARKKAGLAVFKVGVLEAEWWAEGTDLPLHGVPDRDAWRWRVMMSVPTDVTTGELEDIVLAVTSKRGGKLEGSRVAPAIRLLRMPSARCARILHVGPYATEPESFEKIRTLLDADGLERERGHTEIYLSDPNRTASEKLKTALLTRIVG